MANPVSFFLHQTTALNPAKFYDFVYIFCLVNRRTIVLCFCDDLERRAITKFILLFLLDDRLLQLSESMPDLKFIF